MSDQEDYDDYDSDNVSEQEVKEEDDQSIRDDLAQTTFEELLGMREKLGTKIYRDSVLNKLSKTAADDDDDDDEQVEEQEESDSGQDDSIVKAKAPISKKHKLQFKRSHKNCPIEASSKRLDNRHNFTIIHTAPSIKSTAAETFRDPRFDPQCGQFRADKFEKNYQFLTTMKEKELLLLQKQLRKAKTDEAKAKFSKAIKVIKSQLRTEQQKQKQKQVEKKVKSGLAKEIHHESNNTAKPMKDQKPKVFVNKATLKRAQLVEKFKELKKTGRLDKYLERKRKKNATKERKYLDKKF